MIFFKAPIDPRAREVMDRLDGFKNGDSMEPTEELRRRFDAAMMDVYRRALSEVNYKATRFLQMLNDLRGVETAILLLRADKVSDGYTALWELKRLDLTVEALIYDNPVYHSLFDPEDIEIARRRLEEYEYFKNRD